MELDYSFGVYSSSSRDDLAYAGYTKGIDAFTEEAIDVTCTYISFTGFSIYFQSDNVSSFYIYAFTGEATDRQDGDYSCIFDRAYSSATEE